MQNSTGYPVDNMIAGQRGNRRWPSNAKLFELRHNPGILANFEPSSEGTDGIILLFSKEIYASQMQVMIHIVWIRCNRFETQFDTIAKLTGFPDQGIPHKGEQFRRAGMLVAMLYHTVSFARIDKISGRVFTQSGPVV